MNPHSLADTLPNLSVVVVLGHEFLVNTVCNGIERDNCVHFFSMSAATESYFRHHNEASSPLEIFFEQAKLARKNNKRVLVVSGFPSNVDDAYDVIGACPNLSVISQELPTNVMIDKLTGQGLGDTHSPEFKQELVQRINTQRDMMYIFLKGSSVITMHGMKCASKQRHFLLNRISAAYQSLLLKLEVTGDSSRPTFVPRQPFVTA